MNELNTAKIGITAILAGISAFLGNLYVPVLLMVVCNVIDYATGLMAVSSRDEKLSSYRSIKGITKRHRLPNIHLVISAFRQHSLAQLLSTVNLFNFTLKVHT